MRIRGRNLTRLAVGFLFVLFLSTWAQAQSTTGASPIDNAPVHHGQGYLFIGPGMYIGFVDSIAILHVGGGGEALVYEGLGLGAEAGAIGALQESRGGLGLFSVNGSYHLSRQRKISPFLTGGYSSVSGNGQRNLVNFGGGVNYWLRERMGLRLEFRDHVYADGTGRQLLGFRVGFAFR
jgi:hypothetical protein